MSMGFLGKRILAETQVDGAFCSGRVDRAVVLGDDDLILSDETTGSNPRWLHESFPVTACGVGFVAWIASDEFGGFGGTDGFSRATFDQKLEDGGFECSVFFTGLVAAACVRAEFDDIPVAGVLFRPVNEVLAGFAEFLFAWCRAVGFGFVVGHSRRSIKFEVSEVSGSSSEKTAVAERVVFEGSEDRVSEALVEAARLEGEGVEPDGVAVATDCFLFGLCHQLATKACASQSLGKIKQFNMKSRIRRATPETPEQLVCFGIVYVDCQRAMIVRYSGIDSIEVHQLLAEQLDFLGVVHVSEC
jgi:hypothetical protein